MVLRRVSPTFMAAAVAGRGAAVEPPALGARDRDAASSFGDSGAGAAFTGTGGTAGARSVGAMGGAVGSAPWAFEELCATATGAGGEIGAGFWARGGDEDASAASAACDGAAAFGSAEDAGATRACSRVARLISA